MHRTALALIVVAALLVRVVPRWDLVFAEDGLRLADPDAWHHLRQVEQWVRHFPSRMTFDPYALHPGGQDVPVAPLFDGIAATVAWVVGLGAPSAATVGRVFAILPAVLGALTCLPAFALGRRLGGTAGGLVAALVTAALPGQFLVRSMLGFADHHALETLLGATALAAYARALGFAPPRSPRPAQGAALALLGYLLAWTGGALLVVALAAATLASMAADVVRRRDPADSFAAFAYVAGLAAAGVAVLSGSLPTSGVALAALGGGAAALLLAFLVGAQLPRTGVRPSLAVAGMLGALVVAGGIAAVALPGATGTVLAAAGWFTATAERVTVAEAAPLWTTGEGPSLLPVWAEFGAAGVGAIAGLLVLARRVVRDARRDDVLLAVVLAGTIAIAATQARFAANAAVAAAVLTGGALGPWLGRAWRGEAADTPRWLGRGVWPAAVSVALVLPTAPVLRSSLALPATPGEPWREALAFLRESTPEPFGDGAAFERLPERPSPGSPRERPAYGVLAWWDAGYWITGIARRVPVANPTQAGAGEVARVLLETDPGRAADRATALGARYVVLDSELPVLPRGGAFRGQLPSVAAWARRSEDSLVRVLRTPDGDPVAFFLPDYFRSLVVRLHTFGGAATPATDVRGVAWAPARDGAPEIVESRTFGSHEEAAAWAAAHPAGRAFVGSTSPFASCVPLDAAERFRRVFHSTTAFPYVSLAPVWHVQVFEVTAR